MYIAFSLLTTKP